MSVSELCYRGDGVEPRVLSQGGGNDLECIPVGTDAVGVHPLQRPRVLVQPQRQLDLRGSTASNQSPGAQGCPWTSPHTSAHTARLQELPITPVRRYLFFTKHLMTHSASWMERSASSSTSLLEPRTTMLTVFPGFVQPVIWNIKPDTDTGEQIKVWDKNTLPLALSNSGTALMSGQAKPLHYQSWWLLRA